MRLNASWVSLLGGGFLKFLSATWRWSYHHREIFESHIREGGLLLPFWHNRLIGGCTSPIFRDYDTVVVVSRHYDGEIIARIQGMFGHRAIRGSARAGANEALKEMEADIRKGCVVGITPDGARGPKYVVKPGAAILVERTGRPAIPFLTAAERRWKFRSWDNFELPKPFSRCTLLFGNPVLPTGDVEATRRKIEEEMKRMVVEGEEIYGRGPDF
ncbi:MAG: lysophospholipid acyltransferase family protein [Candidatus Hydrogenedentota bacterium]